MRTNKIQFDLWNKSVMVKVTMKEIRWNDTKVKAWHLESVWSRLSKL